MAVSGAPAVFTAAATTGPVVFAILYHFKHYRRENSEHNNTNHDGGKIP
jgi:hypothetical protein